MNVRPVQSAPSPALASRLRVQVEYLPTDPAWVGEGKDRWGRRVFFGTVFEALVERANHGNVRPLLAQALDFDPAGTHLSITLRRGAKFHDGALVTAEDAAASLRNAARIGRGAYDPLQALLSDIDRITVTDPEQLVIALRASNRLILAALSEVAIQPRRAFGSDGQAAPASQGSDPESFASAVAFIGTGPYRVREFQPGTQVVLARYDGYYGQRARMPELVVTAEADPARALAHLRNGVFDILGSLHPAYYPGELRTPAMRERFRATFVDGGMARFLAFNTRQPPLTDRRVRRAIVQLIDRQELANKVRNRVAHVPETAAWLTREGGTVGALQGGAVPATEGELLLDAAGYLLQAKDGVRRRGRQPLHLTILYARESDELATVATLLKNQLRTHGILTTFKAGDFAFVMHQARRGRFDALLVGLAQAGASDLEPLLHARGQLNVMGYGNPQVDHDLSLLQRAQNAAQRVPLIERIQRTLRDDPPLTLLYAPTEILVAARHVHGLADEHAWPDLASLSLSAPAKAN